MALFCELSDLKNESDVEQKLIAPIITTSTPNGLGYSASDFRTKANIREFKIGKGKEEKSYLPDYIIAPNGLPVIIIEAKAPDEDLIGAAREARLYANELNAIFPRNINPCQRIIVSDGKRILCSYVDSSEVNITVSLSEISPAADNYKKFLDFAGKKSIADEVLKIQRKIRGSRQFSKPTVILGGRAVQNEELKENSFGSALMFEYRNLFDPETAEDRREIVKHAYIASRSRKSHLAPMNKIIRAASPPNVSAAREIYDTSSPKEVTDVFKRLREGKIFRPELVLLIGSVGSGKSTFVDYLKEVAIDDELRERTIWVNIDLNDAPISRDAIYPWTRQKILAGLRAQLRDVDWESSETIKRVYSQELSEKRGIFDLISNIDKRNEVLAGQLLELQKDLDATIQGIIKFFCLLKGKTPVIILDNCDKRTSNDQLLMFEVAKWAKDTFGVVIFLPMRDTTYDSHQKSPPLDTVIKDLIFRIDPPLLEEVLYRRASFALKDKAVNFSYSLPGGIRVYVPISEQQNYLKCIFASLFQQNTYFKSLVAGIAGKNIRKGLEIFIDFCKSGHISEGEFLKIKQFNGNYVLPHYLVARVLFKGNRRYYSDEGPHVKNLFQSYPDEDGIPNPYVRVAILEWLKKYSSVKGPNGVKGYHRVASLIAELMPSGHSEVRIRNELMNLIKAECISNEIQATNAEELIKVSDEDLVTLAPAGHAHLGLLSNIEYLASCAEDVWYAELQVAQLIANRLARLKDGNKNELGIILANAEDLISYLERYQGDFFLSAPESYVRGGHFFNSSFLETSRAVVSRAREKISYFDIDKIKMTYLKDRIVEVIVSGVMPYGVFVQIDGGVDGFMVAPSEVLKKGDLIKAKVLEFSEAHNRFQLVFVGKVPGSV